MVSAINIEAECCLDPENRKKNIILLGTLVISSNFLLEFYWLSLSYKKLNYIASYIYNIYLIMSIINVIVTVKGNSNYYHILILFTPQPCTYVN